MISKPFRVTRMIVLAGFALSSAAWAATCSSASLSGTYGFLHDGTDSTGAPATAAVSQLTFDPTAGTFSGETTASHDGTIVTGSLTGTYGVASNCTGTGTPSGGSPFSFVVTPTGFLAVHAFAQGFAVKQSSPACSNAGVKGNFAFQTSGIFVTGAPVTGPVVFIGQLQLTVDSSGEGVITGQIAGSEDSRILTFADGSVTGSYTVGTNCQGTATITPNGLPEMHFSVVVVDGANEMLAIETDANTVVSGTLLKSN